jgi:nucleoid DNA-binding protein
MKKSELAKRLARQSNSTVAEAADRLDRTVGAILRKLKESGQASLPGVGEFTRHRDGGMAFQPESRKRA